MTVKLNKVTINVDNYNNVGELEFEQTNGKLISVGVTDLNVLSNNLKSRLESVLYDMQLELNGKDTSMQKRTLSNYNVSLNKNSDNERYKHHLMIKGFSEETIINLKPEQMESLFESMVEFLKVTE